MLSVLSFGVSDDKPVLVVTHGDLLSLSDRVRIRVYLAELLGIPPTGQIFDIPGIKLCYPCSSDDDYDYIVTVTPITMSAEDNDAPTKLAISEMLTYCLERADRNLPPKDLPVLKVWLLALNHTDRTYSFFINLHKLSFLPSKCCRYLSLTLLTIFYFCD